MAWASVNIKGTKDGLLVTMGEGELASLLVELEERLSGTASFFKGGQVALEVGRRELSVEEIGNIRAVLARNEVALGTVISEAPVTRAAARHLGLETKRIPRPEPRPERRARQDFAELSRSEFSEGALVRCTLRSGQVIRHPGHVVVIGDVNAGAEVIAGGDVVIWGRLRGTVHAGATGDDQAIVCALDLAPTQLRIGKHIARPPEGKPSRRPVPEMAFVQEGRIIVRAWKPAR
ncbi:MAG: septum site-determining protein MinC [Chloroflexi bacterium]|nr:septum site-determining protein MinC [Chloroflexota bacterium]